MGKPHPMALRERAVAFVKEGHSHRAAAARFRVSVKFVNDMVALAGGPATEPDKSLAPWLNGVPAYGVMQFWVLTRYFFATDGLGSYL